MGSNFADQIMPLLKALKQFCLVVALLIVENAAVADPTPPPCPAISFCRKACPNGFLMGLDGCRTCECSKYN